MAWLGILIFFKCFCSFITGFLLHILHFKKKNFNQNLTLQFRIRKTVWIVAFLQKTNKKKHVSTYSKFSQLYCYFIVNQCLNFQIFQVIKEHMKFSKIKCVITEEKNCRVCKKRIGNR